MKIAPALSVVSFLALSTLACSIEVYDPPPRAYGSGSAGDPVEGTQPASPSPVLVEIDTNAKLEAELQQSRDQNAQMQDQLEHLATRLAALEAAKEH